MRGKYGRNFVCRAALILAMTCSLGAGSITVRADEINNVVESNINTSQQTTGDTTEQQTETTTEQTTEQQTETTTEQVVETPFYGLTFKKTSEKSFTCNAKGIITAYTGKKKATEIIVPASIDGVTVKGIGKDVFSNLENVTTIGLPDTVTSLGDEAFSGCSALSTMFTYTDDNTSEVKLSYDENGIITLPDKLKTLGVGTFAGCTAIYKFAIADSNKYFKTGTWVTTDSSTDNQSQTTSSVSRNSGEMLLSKDGATLYRFAPAFHYTGEGLYTLPAGLIYISPYACEAVSLNGGFTIPKTVTTIGDYAFYNCGNLNNVEFAKKSSVTAIGKYAFANNANLHITLPASVKTIDIYSFAYCVNIEIDISATQLQVLPDYAFYECNNLHNLKTPKTLKSVGAYVFYGCDNLNEVEFLGDTLESIGTGAFQSCNNLHTIEVPEGVTAISNDTFDGCQNLNTIILPDSLKSVGDSAFKDCQNIHEMVIPAGVTHISKNSFSGANMDGIDTTKNLLSQKYIKGELPLAGTEFQTGKLKYKVTKSSKTKGTVAIVGVKSKKLTSIKIGKTIMYKGYKFKITSIESGAFKNCKKLKTVTIGSNVKKIGASAFSNCKSLKKVTIGSGVKTIGANAFSKCKKLTTIKFGANVRTIGASAFSSCISLKKVKLGKNVKTIKANAFYNCKKLASVKLDAKLTTIGNKAFYKCVALKKITIPSKVSKIGSKAFYGCKKLQSVTIKTKKLTTKKIGSKAFKGTKSTIKVMVPKKKYKTYKKMLLSKGVSKKGKFYKK